MEEDDCDRHKKAGKTASYLFALIVTIFLAWECVSAEKRGESTPVHVWLPSLVLIGTALGINIDASTVGKFFVK